MEALRTEVAKAEQETLAANSANKASEQKLREQVAEAKNQTAQLDTEMKAAARQLKDKERKFGSLENKIKDLEDEQVIVLEQHQE